MSPIQHTIGLNCCASFSAPAIRWATRRPLCECCAQIEMVALASGDELLHGEAVTIDMALTTEV